MQNQHSEKNIEAWNHGPYDAWLNRLGTPAEAAAKLKQNPEGRVKGLYPYIGDVRGKKIANLLGSHGSKAVALSLLGAESTVIDFASGNARYAEELAKESGVSLNYIVADVLHLPEEELSGSYDIVFMEFGIVHYFIDLLPLMQVVRKLLQEGGRFVLQDFHPVSTKLISSRGTTAAIRKHKVTGDYFDTSLKETDVAYSKYLPTEAQASLKKVQLRQWTVGEIVTAVAQAGLFIRELVEEPNRSSDVFDKGIPKSFTLVADKVGGTVQA